MNLTDNKIKTPLYLRFIEFVRQGYHSLDDNSRREVAEFVLSSSHPDGGFKGRGKRPDIYYSLFGAWLCEALNLSYAPVNEKYINKEAPSGKIEILSSILISVMHPHKDFRKPSLVNLIKLTFFGDRQIGIYYRFFLFVLVYDALFKGRFINFAVRIILPFFSLPRESPCSIYAAMLVARHEVSMGTESQKQLLLSFFEEGRGFKAFPQVGTADLLSTAAALFALKEAGADLRIIAPSCLQFIQENYSSGAFLAGNGDEMRDLEYTFYGLLALGTLV